MQRLTSSSAPFVPSGTTSHLHVEILWSPATLVKSRGTKLVSYLYFPFISNKRQVKRGNCHTLISSGDLCLMTCDLSLVLVRCLAPIIRQFVKFQDMPKNQKNIDAQSVSFRDTPEIKWKHRCIIKWGSVTFRKSKRGWLCNPQGSVTLRKENKYRYEIRKFP